MSGTFQALQSYRIEDIVWDSDAGFRPCIHVTEDKKILVDLNLFHEIDIMPRSSAQNISIKSLSDKPVLTHAATAPVTTVTSSALESSKRKKQRSARPSDAIVSDFFPTPASTKTSGHGDETNASRGALETIEDLDKSSCSLNE